MNKGRSVEISVFYNKESLNGDKPIEAKELTYNDVAAGNCDSMEISLNASDSKWLNSWLPEAGASLKASIMGNDWETPGSKRQLPCGLFVLDDFGYSENPDTLRLMGVSKPADTDFSEQDREYIWKETSIKRIGRAIADRYNLGFRYDAEDINIDTDEQNGPDSSYLNGLCRLYGLALKIYAKELWIYDRESYKQKRPIKTYKREGDIKQGSFSYETSLMGKVTGGVFAYTDPEKDQDIYCQIGGGKKIKNISRRASSTQDAAIQLCAEINNANHGLTKIQFSVDGEFETCAGNNVELSGYGKLDGIYFVDEITHRVSVSSGFTSTLQCSRVEKGFSQKDVGGPPQELTPKQENSGELKQGTAIKLTKANLYVASTSKKRATRVSGTYYLYDGELIAGRYRITNTPSRCGKKPVGHNVTGWVDKDACVIA